MFLSVIISCHNCREYIKRLLNSLIIQDFEDMEIIISDDHSDDGFMEEVNKYSSLLNIKYFLTGEHKYHCPGNTRRDGWHHATGDWITFMDHDDTFAPGAFNLIKTELEKNAQYNLSFVYSPVQRVTETGDKIDLLDAVTWLHGNFYKRSFLIDNNIDFKEDLFGNEDLYFNNLVNNFTTGQGLSILKIGTGLYNWYSNPKSLSNQKEGELTYTEKYFGDYLISNSEPHLIAFDKFPAHRDDYKNSILQCILYSYFYYQRARHSYKDLSKLDQMLKDISSLYRTALEKLQVTEEDIINFMTSNVERFNSSRETIQKLSGTFIESQSVREFIKLL